MSVGHCKRPHLSFFNDKLIWYLVEQVLVALEALRGCPADDGSDGPPLRGHQLGEVKQLLVLVARPLRLLDRRVQPLEPTGLQRKRSFVG